MHPVSCIIITQLKNNNSNETNVDCYYFYVTVFKLIYIIVKFIIKKSIESSSLSSVSFLLS